MANTSSSSLSRPGFYGPITATLDWCEPNYQFSYYIAEMANSFSNLFTISLALLGAVKVYQESLPARYLAGYAGIALVGVGSFAFHATLTFQAQLADELPMVYVASMSLWLLLDVSTPFNLKSPRTRSLAAGTVMFDILFTWSYYLYRNPVYHQVVFASMLLFVSFRIWYLLTRSSVSSRIPDEKKAAIGKIFGAGFALFALGFLIWNLDNIFCDAVLTRWKVLIGWPGAFLLEGHSWWHVLTGSGTYLKFIGIQYITLCLKDDHRKFQLGHSQGLPYIKRVNKREP